MNPGKHWVHESHCGTLEKFSFSNALCAREGLGKVRLSSSARSASGFAWVIAMRKGREMSVVVQSRVPRSPFRGQNGLQGRPVDGNIACSVGTVRPDSKALLNESLYKR